MKTYLFRALFLTCFSLLAQDRAAITGTIFDNSRAAIAGAGVEVSDERTGLVRKIQTQETGTYRVGSLPVGKYTLTVTRDGSDEKDQRN